MKKSNKLTYMNENLEITKVPVTDYSFIKYKEKT